MTAPVLPLAAPRDPALDLVTRDDLFMFDVLHQAMRLQSRALCAALRALDPEDRDTPGQLVAWFANVLVAIEHHHQAEDETFFPLAAAHDPEAAELFGALRGDHHELDRHLQAVAATLDNLDRTRANGGAARQQARALAAATDLVVCLDDHLDREEATAFPIFLRSVPRAAYAAGEAVVHEGGDKRLFAFLAPWLVPSCTPEQADRLFGLVPRIVRVLHRFVWRPRYEAAYPALVAAQRRVAVEQGSVAA